MRGFLAVLALACFVAACAGAADRTPVVSAGASTPRASLEGEALLAATEDRTGLPAYEWGECEADADCVPTACGGVCAPGADRTGLCLDNETNRCLASINTQLCGCVEGACRWQRTATTLRCAWLDESAPPRGKRTRFPTEYPVDPRR